MVVPGLTVAVRKLDETDPTLEQMSCRQELATMGQRARNSSFPPSAFS